jgi:hypothetical protein
MPFAGRLVRLRLGRLFHATWFDIGRRGSPSRRAISSRSTAIIRCCSAACSNRATAKFLSSAGDRPQAIQRFPAVPAARAQQGQRRVGDDLHRPQSSQAGQSHRVTSYPHHLPRTQCFASQPVHIFRCQAPRVGVDRLAPPAGCSAPCRRTIAVVMFERSHLRSAYSCTYRSRGSTSAAIPLATR